MHPSRFTANLDAHPYWSMRKRACHLRGCPKGTTASCHSRIRTSALGWRTKHSCMAGKALILGAISVALRTDDLEEHRNSDHARDRKSTRLNSSHVAIS